MKKLSNSGHNDYDVLNKNVVILNQRNAPCYSRFFSFSSNYTKIRIYGLDCEPTFEYKDFFLQYVIDMFKLEEASFNEEYFEFKNIGIHKKNLLVMVVVRLLWENISGSTKDGVENIKFFLDKLKNGKCRYKDKLKRFCYFYSLIKKKDGCYYGDNHTWYPWDTKIKSTQDFKNCEGLKTVNSFFYMD